MGNTVLAVAIGLGLATSSTSSAQVQAWQGTLTIPTYAWESDVNPKLRALEKGGRGSIVYPYTMQDHLSREKADRTYKALFLENQYLKVTCLPEFGGRIHSVLDKTTNEEMFYLNRVIKPSMIALRGAWISGGIEWNAGPQSHTVTCMSPVNALIGQNADGSAYIEISNLEKTLRTRWTVRVTLHPGRSYLDEHIRLFNPTDAMSPYYFWNCTAFPNRPTTRFIFPMSLGTDHAGNEFFNWPIHEGKDLTWLKNYDQWASIFAIDCTFDFFGAYDVDSDRGIVQYADHADLGGKKAWTWGNWEFGLVSQKNLTDEDGPYIEVQSGPLPTQSDYEALWPRDTVSWQECWYPVHGLGDGFEFANMDVAVQTVRENGQLELRILATAEFPSATCTISNDTAELLSECVDLSPLKPQTVTVSSFPSDPVTVSIRTATDDVLASFVSPLPIPNVTPPQTAPWRNKADTELSAEELYLKGRKADLATNPSEARRYYNQTLQSDAGHTAALRALAVLDIEAGLYRDAQQRLRNAVHRDPTDGLAWYFLGVSHLRLDDDVAALRCAQRAAKCRESVALGHDLAGRAHLRLMNHANAVRSFAKAVQANPRDRTARDHLLLARYAAGDTTQAFDIAARESRTRPTDLIPRAALALRSADEMGLFVTDVRSFVGEIDYEMIEVGLTLTEIGLAEEAERLLAAVCIEPVPENDRDPLVLYFLASCSTLQGEAEKARDYLAQAGTADKDFVFPSRPETVAVLKHALAAAPNDARAHLHLGNLYGHFGRLEQAVTHWGKASELNSSLAIAFRNLARYAQTIEQNNAEAARLYRQAIAARPTDQTLYRDLAKILAANGDHAAAIELLETMPARRHRRADVSLALAKAYIDAERHTDAIELLTTTPHFINWEGASLPWNLFHQAHLARGKQHLENDRPDAALRDFETAMTYPENLGVGRSDRPEHAAAQFWRGKALHALGRADDARAAWKTGASGHEGSDEQNKHRDKCRAALSRDE